MTDILEVVGLTVRYGGNLALDDVSLRVGEGELIGLIGPNGAGKTTFIDALTGFTRSTGSVDLRGESLARLRPHRRVQRGLGRTWQAAELYDELSVRENIEVGATRPTFRETLAEWFTGRSPEVEGAERAVELLGLEPLLDLSPEDLSQGQRKSVDVARALAGGAEMLCLDEPAAGLDTGESMELGRRLRSIVDSGTSVLLVDHDMGLVLSVCDRIYVLDLGRLIAEGTPAEIRTSPRVIEAYLGEQTESTERAS